MSLMRTDCAWKILLLLAVSPFIIMAIHTIILRIFKRRNGGSSQQVIALSSVFWGYVPMGILIWFFGLRFFTGTAMDWMLIIIYCFMIYNFFGYVYLHFFNMSETARRIRILFEIIESKTPITIENILNKRNNSDLISVRIGRLLAMGQIDLQDGNYVLKGSFLYFVARVIELWGYVLGFESIKIKTSKNFL